FNFSLEGWNSLNWNLSEKRVLGLEPVSTCSNLVIFGKPGSGKTTFLQYIALQFSQGKLQPERIPIFIRLRNLLEGASEVENLSLSSYIKQELCNSGISEQQAESLLRYGKALILLDGLDEVQEKDSNTVQKQIRQLSEEYYKNQVIITCRTAAQQYQFEGFTDTEIADFDQAQIAAFVHKWFVSVGRNSRKKGLAKAAQFMEKLQLLENRQIRELAMTPLLLHLACSTFQALGDFSAERTDFYKQVLDILLFRLDEARGIKRDSPYSSLSLVQKMQVLSQIAAKTFEQDSYFFKKSTLQQYIINYLRTSTTASSDPEALQLEGERVLRAIEAQHGLLVEQGQGLYSFSHMAFQVLLTAKDIINSSNLPT
ncbi:MAG TPA: NACHT domain-containing protein, partial [Candidatus Caenarcaniphilales bacterium]